MPCEARSEIDTNPTISSFANARLALIALRALAPFGLQELMQTAVKLARVPRRLLQLALVPRCANRRAQPLRFSVRIRRDEPGQRFVVVEQAVAPRFGPVHQRHRGARLSGDCLEARTNCVSIHSTH